MNIWKEFTNSKNKIYFIIEKKVIVSAILAVLTILVGTYGFYSEIANITKIPIDINTTKNIIDTNNSNLVNYSNSVLKAFKLFSFDFPVKNEINGYTIVASIFATNFKYNIIHYKITYITIIYT